MSLRLTVIHRRSPSRSGAQRARLVEDGCARAAHRRWARRAYLAALEARRVALSCVDGTLQECQLAWGVSGRGFHVRATCGNGVSFLLAVMSKVGLRGLAVRLLIIVQPPTHVEESFLIDVAWSEEPVGRLLGAMARQRHWTHLGNAVVAATYVAAVAVGTALLTVKRSEWLPGVLLILGILLIAAGVGFGNARYHRDSPHHPGTSGGHAIS